MNIVHYMPILTTLFSVYFFSIVFLHWRTKRKNIYLLIWAVGILIYGVGTFMESYVTLLGWNVWVFKLWYISGAILGGVILAQGSIYLLMPRKFAHISSVIILTAIIIATAYIIASPIDYTFVEAHRLTGKVLAWKFVRLFTPFINIYAFVFLVGGAMYSAIRYYKKNITGAKFKGNLMIALGGLLPGIGGSFTRFGYTEVLYVTELVGLLCIFAGYYVIKNEGLTTLHTHSLEETL